MNETARKLGLLGLTDVQIAQFFDVNPTTIYDWKRAFPAFAEALNAGKVIADAEVAASLYQRAIGQVTFIEKRVKGENGEYEIIQLRQSIPADANAAAFWLTNRQRDLWANRKAIEHSGPDGGPLETRTITTEMTAEEAAKEYASTLRDEPG